MQEPVTPTPKIGRDYENTGTGTGVEMVYVQIKLSGNQSAKQFVHFQVGKDDTRVTDQITGYLENVMPPDWKPAIPKTTIGPHWEYKIILMAKDDADGVVKPFCISLSAHWRNGLVSNFFNQLAGAMATDAWQDPDNRLVRFSVYLDKDSQAPKGYLWAGPKPAPALPNKYKWDDAVKKFVGTPDVPVSPDGKYDFSVASDFWHNEVILLSQVFGNDASKSSVAPGTGIQGTGNYAAAAQTSATTAAATSLPTKGMTWIEKKMDAATIRDQPTLLTLTKELFGLMEKQNPTEADRVSLGQAIYTYGCHPTRRIFDALKSQQIDRAGNLVDNAPPAATDPFGVALPGNVDDLPF